MFLGSLERLGQEEALLHVVVGRVGGVDVLHSGETSAHPAVLIDGLGGDEERGKEARKRERKGEHERDGGRRRKSGDRKGSGGK